MEFIYNYKKELKKYLNTYDDIESEEFCYDGNGKDVYYNLFFKPVNLIFYCEDDSYSGDILAIFEYKSIYIVAYGNFGSCNICDPWEGNTLLELKDGIEDIFSRLEYYKNIDDIQIYNYYSDDVVNKLIEFKENKNKQ